MAETAELGAERSDPRRTSRTAAGLAARLERWLCRRLGRDAAPVVEELAFTSGSGLSSETLLVTASFEAEGVRHASRLVVRMAPDPGDVPVFPRYDLGRQARLLGLLADAGSVPVPRVRFFEPDASHLGAPFFVMDEVEGRVPPDVPPYVFPDSWLTAATAAERRQLEEGVVDVLAGIHGLEQPVERFGFLVDEDGPTPLRRHVANRKAWYEFAAADVGRCELIERCFAWLEDHWPADEGSPVLSWGDARIGNLIVRDWRPAAVLDWEMAGLGPRELDVAWLLYSHRMFQWTAEALGFEGLPEFLREDDVVSRYEATSGQRLCDLRFYELYAATQFGIVGMRTSLRSVRFGERPMPETVEDLLFNRDQLEQILAAARVSDRSS
jgi:aminoglycoside phosphotransferase (APT) family kinase protein